MGGGKDEETNAVRSGNLESVVFGSKMLIGRRMNTAKAPSQSRSGGSMSRPIKSGKLRVYISLFSSTKQMNCQKASILLIPSFETASGSILFNPGVENKPPVCTQPSATSDPLGSGT